MSTLFLILLLLGDALLLAPDGSPLRVAGALILLLLPGLAWTDRLLPTTDRFTRWIIGAGLSYTLAMVLGLILHYLPGPIPLWAELAVLNALILIPVLVTGRWSLQTQHWSLGAGRWSLVAISLALVVILAALFRFINLGYSEFQGDEALALIAAAEALEGHQDALFLRGKGPGEVLLPMALWRLTGTINEAVARLPFAIAGLLMVLTIYFLGRNLFSSVGKEERLGQKAGLIAAGLLALNGFMVGFSRIVQYQVLVVWMSGLALLCAWLWRNSKDPRTRHYWAGLTGAFLGAGLLAHYDAILVIPAIAFVFLSDLPQISRGTSRQTKNLRPLISGILFATGCLLLVAGLFYLPYALDPQATRTGDYLGDRIGDGLLKNNLEGFLHFNVFYNSSYYVILTGLLVLGYLAWALSKAPGVRRIPGGHYWVPALTFFAALALVIRPSILQIAELDLAALLFALILLGAFLSPVLDTGQRAVVAWLAVPFLGYNFAVALPLTHIYTIVPAWTLLTGLSGAKLLNYLGHISNLKSRLSTVKSLLLAICLLLLVALFSVYLYSAYLRQDLEFWQDWPESRSALYWSPYDELPPAGFFGGAHRTGWKTLGTLYSEGVLKGDYGSNEEPEVTTWYTRGAPRACDPQPEYFFIADDLVDAWPVDLASIEASYDTIGKIGLPNGKGLTVHQTSPSTIDLGHLETDHLRRAFDQTANPAAFARSARGSQPTDADFGGLVRLIGYNIDTRRAGPGGRLPITLYWQVQTSISDDYHAFVHLEGDEQAGSASGIWGQADGRPVCWTYPTFDWRPGQIIADQHAVTIKPGIPSGDYRIRVGMYLPETGARLDVLDEMEQPVANFVELTSVPIK